MKRRSSRLAGFGFSSVSAENKVRRIVRSAAADHYRFSSLVMGIVSSDAFQLKRVSAEPVKTARN